MRFFRLPKRVLAFIYLITFLGSICQAKENLNQIIETYLEPQQLSELLSQKKVPPIVRAFYHNVFQPLVGPKERLALYQLKPVLQSQGQNNPDWLFEIFTVGYMTPFSNDKHAFNVTDTELRFFHYTIRIPGSGASSQKDNNSQHTDLSWPEVTVDPSGLEINLQSGKKITRPLYNSTLVLDADELDDNELKKTIPNPQLLQNLTTKLKQLFRADPFLHPLSQLKLQLPILRAKYSSQELHELISEGGKTLTEDQKSVIDQLKKLDLSSENNEPEERQGPRRFAVVMPTGSGKTVTIGSYLERLIADRKFSPQDVVIIVYQNTTSLEQHTDYFSKLLKIDPENMVKLYGKKQTSMSTMKPNDIKLVVATRSSYMSHIKELEQLFSNDTERKRFFFFDESHHVAAAEGEFNAIFFGSKQNKTQGLIKILNQFDRIVFASATMWHRDDLITKRYAGKRIATVRLSDKEKEQLFETEDNADLEKLSTQMLLRYIATGDLALPEKIVLYQERENGDRNKEVNAWSQWIKALNESIRKVISVKDNSEAQNILKKDLKLYQVVIKLIAQNIIKYRKSGILDHGIIRVPTIAHANFYRLLLERELKEVNKNQNNSVVEVYHSGLTEEQKKKIKEDFLSSSDFYNHRYLIVVDAVNEAVDIPHLNLIINAAPTESYRTLLQIFGRGARIRVGKSGFRLIDLTGNFSQLIQHIYKSQLPTSLIEVRETNADEMISGLINEAVSPSQERIAKVKVTESKLVPERDPRSPRLEGLESNDHSTAFQQKAHLAQLTLPTASSDELEGRSGAQQHRQQITYDQLMQVLFSHGDAKSVFEDLISYFQQTNSTRGKKLILWEKIAPKLRTLFLIPSMDSLVVEIQQKQRHQNKNYEYMGGIPLNIISTLLRRTLRTNPSDIIKFIQEIIEFHDAFLKSVSFSPEQYLEHLNLLSLGSRVGEQEASDDQNKGVMFSVDGLGGIRFFFPNEKLISVSDIFIQVLNALTDVNSLSLSSMDRIIFLSDVMSIIEKSKFIVARLRYYVDLKFLQQLLRTAKNLEEKEVESFMNQTNDPLKKAEIYGNLYKLLKLIDQETNSKVRAAVYIQNQKSLNPLRLLMDRLGDEKNKKISNSLPVFEGMGDCRQAIML